MKQINNELKIVHNVLGLIRLSRLLYAQLVHLIVSRTFVEVSCPKATHNKPTQLFFILLFIGHKRLFYK